MNRSFIVVKRRALAMALAVLLAIAGVVAMPVAASAADTRPEIEQRSESRTVTADALPTVQIDNGVVWAQTMVGNKVYVGGEFSNARPAGAAKGTNLVPRQNLLAYDITTGVLDTSWAPTVNGAVKSIAASPDGSRIYVGGSFTVANGSTRYLLAAFDAQTGALISGFNAAIGGSYINAIVATDTTVYVGGLIGAANGVARKNLAAVSSSGALLGWAPTTDLQVDAMVMDPTKTKVIIGGRFGTVNGAPQRGLGALDPVSGALVPWAAPSTVINGKAVGESGSGSAGIWGLATDANTVYGTGWVYADITVGNLEGTFAAEAGSGDIRWIADCHGDHYGVFSDGQTVYSTSHVHACETINMMPQGSGTPGNMRNSEALTPQAKGVLSRSQNVSDIYKDWSGSPAPAPVNWFPDWLMGSYTDMGQAGYSITGDGDYISVGGEFIGVNNQGQNGLVRFAKRPAGGAKQGPRLDASGWATPSATSIRTNEMRISVPANWDRDDLDLTYELLRDGGSTPIATKVVKSTFWNMPVVSFVDPAAGSSGTSRTYRVRVKDGDGNSVTSAPVTGTVSSLDLGAYANAVVNDGASSYWRLGGTTTSKPDLLGALNATAGSGVSQTAGALTGDSNTASSFSGNSNGRVATTSAVAAPTEFTEELWFKAPTGVLGIGSGRGKLIGFGSSASGSSGSYDRHIYMQSNGRLTFGTYPGAVKVISTSASYQDNTWHHLVATQSANGSYLYVDGALAASDPSMVSAQDYRGYWRIGGDTLSGWPNVPSNTWFNGSIDEVAIYPKALSAADVASHYQLGKGAVPPTAAFTSSTNDLTVNVDASSSTAASSRTITGYSWDFGDNTPSVQGRTASHDYAAAGDYTVSLTVTDSVGVSSTTTKTVTVTAPHEAPTAAFTASTNGLKASFDGTGSSAADGATISSYAWQFGDGATSTNAKPTHTYDAAGTYAVKLTVTDSEGASSSVLSKDVTVTHADPVAAFTATTSNLSASFDAGASSASDGATLTYAWDFGDDATGTGRTAAHEYDGPGTYAVKLTVTDSLGGEATLSKDVTVTAPSAAAVKVSDDFTRNVASGWGTADVGGAWSGTAAMSVSGGQGNIAMTKGETRTTVLPVSLGHTVSTFDVSLEKVADAALHVNFMMHRSSAGEYRLKLRYAASGSVNVGVARLVGGTETLMADRVISGYTQTAGGTLKVKVEAVQEGTSTRVRAKAWPSGSAEPSDWSVSALDGQAALQSAGAIGYAVAASGSITNGPVVVGIDNLRVVNPDENQPPQPPHADPVAAFSATPSDLTVAVDATASTASDDATLTYAWDFGDNGTGNGSTASHTYAAAGTYPVKLTLTDSLGGTSTLTKNVTVTDPPPVDPPDPAAAVSDDFGRNVASGWGTADVGGAWSGTAAMSVSGGQGNIAMTKGETRTTVLPVSLGHTVSTFDVSLEKVADAALHVNFMMHRSSAGEYRLKLRYAASGSVNVGVARLVGGTETLMADRAISGYTQTAGGTLKVKVETVQEGTSTRVRAKAWPSGSAEPSDWSVSALDGQAALQSAGAIGYAVAASGSITNGPVVVGIDNLRVVTN